MVCEKFRSQLCSNLLDSVIFLFKLRWREPSHAAVHKLKKLSGDRYVSVLASCASPFSTVDSSKSFWLTGPRISAVSGFSLQNIVIPLRGPIDPRRVSSIGPDLETVLSACNASGPTGSLSGPSLGTRCERRTTNGASYCLRVGPKKANDRLLVVQI